MAKQIRISTDSQVVDAKNTVLASVAEYLKHPYSQGVREDMDDALAAYGDRFCEAELRVETALKVRADLDARQAEAAKAAKAENKARKRLAKLDAMRAELAAQIAPRKVEVG